MTYEDSDIGVIIQRLELVEETLNSIQTAISNLANLDQVRQLMLLKEKEYTEQGDKLDELWDMVQLLKAEVYK